MWNSNADHLKAIKRAQRWAKRHPFKIRRSGPYAGTQNGFKRRKHSPDAKPPAHIARFLRKIEE